MKLFQVTVPNEYQPSLVQALQEDLGLLNVVSIEAHHSSILSFRVEDEIVEALLTELQLLGVGVEFGFCDVMTLTPGTTVGEKRKTESSLIPFSNTLPPLQIHANIEAMTVYSTDTMCLLIISSIISGVGLGTDNRTFVVASMLVSPLMGPILGCALGFAILDRQLFLSGVLYECIALFTSVFVGGLVAVVMAPTAEDLVWPTEEMRTRGVFLELFFGGVVALAGGASAALSECNANISSVVGTAIAASLLPPCVNLGMCLGYGWLGPYITPDVDINVEVYNEIALGSAMLLVVNLVLIYAAAVAVFKTKSLSRFQFLSKNAKAFKNLPASRPSPGAYLRNQKRRLSLDGLIQDMFAGEVKEGDGLAVGGHSGGSVGERFSDSGSTGVGAGAGAAAGAGASQSHRRSSSLGERGVFGEPRRGSDEAPTVPVAAQQQQSSSGGDGGSRTRTSSGSADAAATSTRRKTMSWADEWTRRLLFQEMQEGDEEGPMGGDIVSVPDSELSYGAAGSAGGSSSAGSSGGGGGRALRLMGGLNPDEIDLPEFSPRTTYNTLANSSMGGRGSAEGLRSLLVAGGRRSDEAAPVGGVGEGSSKK